MAKRLLGEFRTSKPAILQNYIKLITMQIETINNNIILKTWYINFTRPAGVHYNHCVSLTIRPMRSSHIRPLGLMIDKSTFAEGRAHYSQLICTLKSQLYYPPYYGINIMLIYCNILCHS